MPHASTTEWTSRCAPAEARAPRAYSRTEGRWEVGAFTVDHVVDTNGAGDAYVAGLLAATFGGGPLEESLRWAAANGALCVQSIELVSPAVSRESVGTLAKQAITTRWRRRARA